MKIALSAVATGVAVDVVELKIVVFRPLDGATFVSLYTLGWGVKNADNFADVVCELPLPRAKSASFRRRPPLESDAFS